MAQHGADKYGISAGAEPGVDPAQALLDICPWLRRINFQNQGSDKDRPGVSVLQIRMAWNEPAIALPWCAPGLAKCANDISARAVDSRPFGHRHHRYDGNGRRRIHATAPVLAQRRCASRTASRPSNALQRSAAAASSGKEWRRAASGKSDPSARLAQSIGSSATSAVG